MYLKFRENIKHLQIKDLSELPFDESTNSFLKLRSTMVELLESITARNHKYIFWADYVELRSLRLMYLKHKIPAGFRFKRPGSYTQSLVDGQTFVKF